ncbi:MAG: ANTAR domain-containing protein [Pseudomonadota bacterium]
MASSVLSQLRGLKVLVVHPPDGERNNLVQHLNRIGCEVRATWPLPGSMDVDFDVLFFVASHDERDRFLKLSRSWSGAPPTLLALVDYEDPSTLQLVLECGALASVGKPIRPFGLLTNLVIARALWQQRSETRAKVDKLEHKLAGIRNINKAKSILIKSQGLSEEEAYRSIRAQAMSKRVSMDEIAMAIINANELLSFRPKR